MLSTVPKEAILCVGPNYFANRLLPEYEALLRKDNSKASKEFLCNVKAEVIEHILTCFIKYVFLGSTNFANQS